MVKGFSDAQRATADAEKKLDVAESAKRPNQKNLAKLRKELESMKMAEDEALQRLQAALSKLEMASNTSETYRQFEQPTISLENDA